MATLRIDEVPVGALSANPWNTNVVTPENEAKIEASLKRFGFFRPVLAREHEGSLQILGGEHRWTVAKRLGYKTVPVINLGHLDDQKAQEIGLVDNGRYGEDDALALSELLKGLGGTDDLLTFLPYSGDELESLFSSSSIALDELDIPDDDGSIPELPAMKEKQTHQIMRFKVPVEDVDFIQRLVESTMRAQGFTGDDSMTNAGNALVHLMRGATR